MRSKRKLCGLRVPDPRELVMCDAATDDYLLTAAEAAEAARDQALHRAERAEARVAELEAEVRRLSGESND